MTTVVAAMHYPLTIMTRAGCASARINATLADVVKPCEVRVIGQVLRECACRVVILSEAIASCGIYVETCACTNLHACVPVQIGSVM